mmetsp:Transcript_12631/g.38279  ORF Transcript_12631/g.38279 Transcript_12631/m.38279 type:complete len:114 (+) Transcript_12631:80-421(+)
MVRRTMNSVVAGVTTEDVRRDSFREYIRVQHIPKPSISKQRTGKKTNVSSLADKLRRIDSKLQEEEELKQRAIEAAYFADDDIQIRNTTVTIHTMSDLLRALHQRALKDAGVC